MYRIIRLAKISFYLTLLFYSITVNCEENLDFKNYSLNILLSTQNNFTIKNIEEDKIIKGTFLGKIENLSNKKFNNSIIECDVLGHSYKGRGFSCGFAEVEDLNGYCKIKFQEKKNIMLIDWRCKTTAGMMGDAVCKGKLNILKGFGEYAGVIGFGKIEMPLIKSIIGNGKASFPMKLQLSLKQAIQLRTQLNN